MSFFATLRIPPQLLTGLTGLTGFQTGVWKPPCPANSVGPQTLLALESKQSFSAKDIPKQSLGMRQTKPHWKSKKPPKSAVFLRSGCGPRLGPLAQQSFVMVPPKPRLTLTGRNLCLNLQSFYFCPHCQTPFEYGRCFSSVTLSIPVYQPNAKPMPHISGLMPQIMSLLTDPPPATARLGGPATAGE